MIWSKPLETGIPVIDEQHRQLFRQADALMDNANKNRISETLDFLDIYVQKHFVAEEVMQARSQYPRAADHRKHHAAFAQALKDLRKEYTESGHKLAILMKINKTVVEWLQNHIMGQDKDFAVYYKQLGGR